MTWEVFLQRAKQGQFQDRDLRGFADGAVYRGPIDRITLGEDGLVRIFFLWLARREGCRWVCAGTNAPAEIDPLRGDLPIEGTNGEITFYVFCMGPALILPPGYKLSSSEVKGLEAMLTR